MKKNSIFKFTLAILLNVCGISHSQILIGQTSSFSGPSAGAVAENTRGAKLYIDAVNAKGGVNGSKLELLSMDDKWDAGVAVKNAKTLILEKKVVALFLNRSTNLTEAILPVLDEYSVPLIAPTSGASFLHSPVKRNVFNVRAPLKREAFKAVLHLASMNNTRIAVMHANDGFGEDAVAGAKEGFSATGISPKFIAVYDRKSPNFEELAARAVQEDVQAVLLFGPSNVVAKTTALMRQQGSKAQIVTLSNNAAAGFIEDMGHNAPGTIVTQVMPSERNVSVAVVREATALARQGGVELSPSLLEGFLAAKVLVEGIRRAGPGVTREKLRNALESITSYDAGGLQISYSQNDHSGLDFVDISIVTVDGRFRR